MTNILSDLRRLTEAVHAAGADIAPTYREYVQLAFAIATDCGEAGRSDFLMLCSLSAKYDVHAANKLFSNALKTNNNSIHIGTAFHLAELCNVRPRPAEKPRQDTPTGTLGTRVHRIPPASHTHAHGYYNRAEMPAEKFPEAPAASLPAEAADAGTANSGTACSGTTYPGTTYPEAADPEAADEETCRGSEPLTPLPCFDNRTLWPAPLNEITAHGTTRRPTGHHAAGRRHRAGRQHEQPRALRLRRQDDIAQPANIHRRPACLGQGRALPRPPAGGAYPRRDTPAHGRSHEAVPQGEGRLRLAGQGALAGHPARTAARPHVPHLGQQHRHGASCRTSWTPKASA